MAEKSEDEDTHFAVVKDHFVHDDLLASTCMGEKKSFMIFTFGKTGSGKSSLGKAIVGVQEEAAPKDQDGWAPNEAKATRSAPKDLYGWAPNEAKATRFRAIVDSVDVVVTDTPGLCDGLQSTNDEETVELMGDVLSNDCSGVIIICLEMHQRMDESTIKPLIDLHQKFGSGIWSHVIIALTKADRYEEDKWLKEKPSEKPKAEYLKCRFAKQVEDCKAYLKAIFTEDRFKSMCRIGMTQSEYEKLQIPIVPTSQLKKWTIKMMNKVGCKHWFDELLMHCWMLGLRTYMNNKSHNCLRK